MIIHCMRQFNVLEFVKEIFCDFINTCKLKSYNLLNFTRDNATLNLDSISLHDLGRSRLMKRPALVQCASGKSEL